MIAIIDYGAGNLKSVSKALERLDVKNIITSSPSEIDGSDAIILPGVGSFGQSMAQIKEKGLDKPIVENVKQGKHFLGICLGMQMLFEKSYEDGEWDGLGLLKGEIVKLETQLKVPHMGWNQLVRAKGHPIMQPEDENLFVYFVHSYYAKLKNQEDLLYYADYDLKIPAIVGHDHVLGMQFHPEKSGNGGMHLLKNFIDLVYKKGESK